MANEDDDAHEREGEAARGHGHVPPGGADPRALGWHVFHRPPRAEARGRARLAAIAASEVAAAPPPSQPDPERQPLVTHEAEGLRSPLVEGTHADLLELALALPLTSSSPSPRRKPR